MVSAVSLVKSGAAALVMLAMVVELLCGGKTPADLPYQTFDNGIVTINTETAAALGMDDNTLNMIKEAFKPYCTEIVVVTTQENF